MSKVTAPDKTARARFLDWVSMVTRMPYPQDSTSVTALKESAVKPGVKWYQFRMFLIFVFTEYGSYGRNMYAAQETLGEDFGVSRPTVRKWLALAEVLGLASKVAEANRAEERGATYEIRCPWDEVPVAISGPRFVQSWQDEPPY